MSIRVLTWNVQGRERPDLAAVAHVIRASGADVVALQEIQRGQARRLADDLGWWVDWRFKHWSVVVPAEGLALLAAAPLSNIQRSHLAATWRFWSWRRRIAVAGTATTSEGAVRVVGTHLGAGVDDAERTRQAIVTTRMVRGAACVVGDLNAHPGSAVLAAYAEAGLRDAWSEVRPAEPGATNWRPGPRDGTPTQRLDYVLVTAGVEVVAVELPRHGEPGFEGFGALSDHLPLLAEVCPRS